MLAIFDLDGVLVNTHQIHTQALRNAVKQFVSVEASKINYLDARDGVRTIQKLKRLQVDFSLSDSQVRNIEWMKTTLTKMSLRYVEQSPHATAILSKLKKNGWTIAIASNSRREFVEPLLEGLKIKHLLNLVICGDEVNQPKPHPAIFLTAMDLLHEDASNTVIFEDSPVGLEAAKASGAKVVQVDPSKLLQMEDVVGL